MDVSENSGFSPQIIHYFNRVSMKKTIHFGVPLFLETPIYSYYIPHMLHGTGIFTYILVQIYGLHVSKYLIHGAYGYTGFRDDNGN